MSNFTVIDGSHQQHNLIFATWLKSYQAASPNTKHIPRDDYFTGHHKVLERIFARKPTVMLAVLPDDHEVILGYSVTENDTIHYVYVKPAFRRYGIATALLGASGISPRARFTHYTYVIRLMHERVKEMTYNPYLA